MIIFKQRCNKMSNYVKYAKGVLDVFIVQNDKMIFLGYYIHHSLNLPYSILCETT